MKKFTSIHDVQNLNGLIELAQTYKQQAFRDAQLGQHKRLVLLFFNPSLRTRLSTQAAAHQLGLYSITMNAANGWQLEFEEGKIMNANKAEHIKEAAAVISQYADIIGIRTFPSLDDRAKDYSDFILHQFIQYASVPVVSLESAIRHPLQSLADLLTIAEHKERQRPKVVLSWAPHPKALPQAVANSFVEWVAATDAELVVTHPPGYELAPEFGQQAQVVYDQKAAFEEADFVYVKNWSSYKHYGQRLAQDHNWMVTLDKLQACPDAKVMHCLPVRRNVVIEGKVLDSPHSLVIEQANNRTFAAQAVLSCLLNPKNILC
ncbi:MAG: N-acetylornithine carbamoyltransferase [Bacteroidota bacterium]